MIRAEKYLSDISDRGKEIEAFLLSIKTFNPKFILTGSIVTYMLGITHKTPGDIDLSLTEPLTEEELESFKDFFNLKIRHENENYEGPDNSIKKIQFNAKSSLNQRIIQFYKGDNIRIDIFNTNFIKDNNDIIDILYDTIPMRVVHPAVAIGYKAKYAFTPKGSSSYKHFEDLKDIILNGRKYFEKLKEDI